MPLGRFLRKPKLSLRALLLIVPVAGLCLGWFGEIVFEQVYGSPVERKIARLVRRAESVPMVIGKWQAVERPFYRRIEDREIFTGISRTYVHDVTGDSIIVWVAAGKPGPMSVEMPEPSYYISNFKVAKRDIASVGLSENNAHFKTRVYESTRNVASDNRHLWWSYNAGSKWEAPVSPRFHFRDRQVLTRIHLCRANTSDCIEKGCDCPLHAFTEDFLPVLNSALYGSQSSP